jgi:hypothetical protein
MKNPPGRAGVVFVALPEPRALLVLGCCCLNCTSLSGFPRGRIGAMIETMSPRIIHIPLSGGDRKAQAKGIRYAHGLHESYFKESVLIRSAAEAKIREADRLECEAWNAIMWAGGPAMPSPGEPQAEPTIAKAINGGYDLLEAKCNRCDRVSLVPLRALRHPPDTPVWKLEAALYCQPCSEGRHYSRRQRAHILGLTCDRPEPNPKAEAARP